MATCPIIWENTKIQLVRDPGVRDHSTVLVFSYRLLIFLIGSLRTVPTFVSAQTFCASRKPWFKRARAGVDIDAINYAIKHMTKIKAKFSYGDQINFNKPVLKPGRPRE